ncbi:galactoside-binding lectin domain-containing protein [Ditylenchus destructor]|nr:galactoside-binding lectin domain-containing protein [Ditylenchus destructor]
MNDIRAIGEGDFTIPYTLNTECVIDNGYCLQVIGKVAQDPHRIDIYQRSGQNDDDYTQLHISIRFDGTPAILFNSVEDKVIRNEQIIPFNPFKAGEHFDFRAYFYRDYERLKRKEEEYESLLIFANRKQIGAFKVSDAKRPTEYVSISGTLCSLKIFRVTNHLCHNYCFNHGFSLGSRLDMAFLVKGSSGCLEIDKNPTEKTKNWIGVYPQPSFNMLRLTIDYYKRAIFLSSNDSGEEEQKGFPLEKDEIVDLTVLHQEKSFRIFFNHKFYTEYSKKYDLNINEALYGARQIVTDPEMMVIHKTVCYKEDDDFETSNGMYDREIEEGNGVLPDDDEAISD